MLVKGDRVKIVQLFNKFESSKRYLDKIGTVTLSRPLFEVCLVSIDDLLGADQIEFYWEELEKIDDR